MTGAQVFARACKEEGAAALFCCPGNYGEDTESGIQLAYQQPTTDGMKKYGKRLVTPGRVHEYTADAFRQLRSGVSRPVHLDFPAEVTSGASRTPASRRTTSTRATAALRAGRIPRPSKSTPRLGCSGARSGRRRKCSAKFSWCCATARLWTMEGYGERVKETDLWNVVNYLKL